MFRVDEGRVVDATRAGSIAHLINHSCQVSSHLPLWMYTPCASGKSSVGREPQANASIDRGSGPHLLPGASTAWCACPDAISSLDSWAVVQPNCFSRVVSASGEERVIIFARRNIQVGEELTYDYRFQSRDEEQLQCNCGAPACRGVVNKEEGEEDDDDLTFGPQDSSTFRLPVVAPLSQLQRLPKPNLHKRGADMVIGTTGERETVGV